MICVFFYQPFYNQTTDYVTIFMEIALIVYLTVIISIGLNLFDASGSNYAGYFAVALLILTIIVGSVWLVYLTYDGVKRKGCCPSE